tara:strand:+ start:8534 stop:9358 length:825 start_codon:yes stop_codon:yes gene_type:complete
MGGNTAAEVAKDVTVGPKQGPQPKKSKMKDFIGAETFDYGPFTATATPFPKGFGGDSNPSYSQPQSMTMGNPATMTQAQARAELQKIGPTISGSGGNYNDLSSFDNYNFSGSPYTLEYFKAVAAKAGDGDELNVIHGGSGGKPANTSPSNTGTTTTGNAASTAESTSADTLKSSQQGVTISDEAKAKAAALNLELVNTDAIQGTNEADTLQKKQAALLEAERRQAIRRLIARNRRARFGGSRLLMSSARANPGLGVPQNQTTLSPRMNPRDIYA